MWHVDEGTLHAYLDERERGEAAGALDPELRARVTSHLAVCDVCSAQLRLAERQRATAADILLAASPAIETPPFEAVQPLATAAQHRPASLPITPRRAPRRTWMPLAWAASLVLAVGAGWMASVLWQGGEVPHPESAVSPATDGSNVDQLQLDLAGPSPATARSAAAPSAAAPGATVPVGSDLQGSVASAEETNEATVREGRAPAAGVPPPPSRPGGEAARLEEAAREPAARLGQIPAAGNRLADAPAAFRPTDAAVVGAAGRVNAQAAAAPERRLAAADQALGFVQSAESEYPGDADVAWRPVSREEAERLLGEPIYLLAGAPIAEIAASPEDSRALVRVRQQTPEGQIELLQWPMTGEQKGGVVAQKSTAGAARETRRDTSGAAQRQAAAEVQQEAKARVRSEAAAVPAAPAAAPPAELSQLSRMLTRARDGGNVLALPATTHPVMLKTPAGVDPRSLLLRIRQ